MIALSRRRRLVPNGHEGRIHPTRPHNGLRPTLSIVVPMFNEEEVIDAFFRRLGAVLEVLGVTYEVICVNDGSRDGTAVRLAAAHRRDPHVKVINLSRNFGKEIALTAGLDHARGAAVVPIDADLQDPPELIAAMLSRWRDGYDVVLAVRSARLTDTWAKRFSARAFYAVINRMSRVRIPSNAGDFRLMDHRVVETLQHMRERNRFMKGLFAWVGFRQCEIEYERPERHAGTTKFNYWRLWNFALDGITGYSTLPLRLAGYIGALTALTALIYGLYLVLRTIIFGADLPGYASIMVAVLFMGGIQLIVMGVIGEYLGRTFEEAKHRPIYVIESAQGIEPLETEVPRHRTVSTL
jgi:polyisoprenyl-phosphate glycosyltransferase